MAPAPKFRPARKADAAALAVLVKIAGEGMPAMWSTLKASGQSVLEFGRERAARETGGFCWRNTVVAELDGEVAASLVDYRLDDSCDLGVLDETPEIVHPLVKLEAKAAGSWYVNVLATFPEFGLRGIGGELLAIAEGKAREEGAPSLASSSPAGTGARCASTKAPATPSLPPRPRSVPPVFPLRATGC
jgi:GNAT superfamily N-acetyltransferase